MGYQIHVIGADVGDEVGEVWIDSNPLIIRYNVQTNYPRILLQSNLSFFEKVYYRLALKTVLRKARGTPYDRGQFMEQGVLDKAAEIINRYSIDNLISTGAPFSFLRYGCLIKRRFPHIKCLSDLRDPWCNGVRYGFADLKPDRFAWERQNEKMVAEESDILLSPAKGILNYMVVNYGISWDKAILLPHAYDGNYSPINRYCKEKIFLFGGNLSFEGGDEQFTKLMQALKVIKINCPNMLKEVVFHFYLEDKSFNSLVPRELKRIIEIRHLIDQQTFFAESEKSSVLMILLSDHLKDYFTSKFFELLSFNKWLLVVADDGELTNMLSEHGLGRWGNNPEDIKESIIEILLLLDNGIRPPVFEELNSYKFENQAKKLVQLLK